MCSQKSSGFKPLTPLTPAALDLRTGIFCCIFNGLLKSSKSSWILALELRLKQKTLRFCGVQDHLLSPAVILPLQGSGYSPALTLGEPTHQSFQSKTQTVMHPCAIATPKAMEKHHG
jgi:hypothetical protein